MFTQFFDFVPAIMDAWQSLQSSEQALLASAITIVAAGTLTDILTSFVSRSGKTDLGNLKKAIPRKAHGILFGRYRRKIIYSPTDTEGHVAVIGGSGSGKTSALLIPTLRAWTGSCLTIDISGDICRNVQAANKLIYEPSNPQTAPYNIFAPIDNLNNVSAKNEALAQLAYLLMPTTSKSDDAAAYFQTEGRKILIAALIAYYHQGLDFIPICKKIISQSWQELFTNIDASKNEQAILYINGFAGSNEKNTSGCKQACDAAITLFGTNDLLAKTVRRSQGDEKSYTPTILENMNVFVAIEDAKLELYAPLLHIITAQTLEYLSYRQINHKSKTILLALDEFVSLGNLAITPALRKLRKKHVRIMILTQSLADLDLYYGRDERMSMLTNFRYLVVLGAGDSDTQEYLARLVGKHQTQTYSISQNNKSITRTRSDAKDYIIDPADFGRLGKHLILIHDRGYLRLRKNFYFK